MDSSKNENLNESSFSFSLVLIVEKHVGRMVIYRLSTIKHDYKFMTVDQKVDSSVQRYR